MLSKNTINENLKNSVCILVYDNLYFLECEKYKYGDGCQLDCGNCLGLKDCEKSSGICKEGCHNNWYGPHCNYCKYRKFFKQCMLV